MRDYWYLCNHKSIMDETQDRSPAARQKLYAEIVNTYYKEKQARAEAQAWSAKRDNSGRRANK